MVQSGAIRSRLETLKHWSEPATLGLEGRWSEALNGLTPMHPLSTDGSGSARKPGSRTDHQR